MFDSFIKKILRGFSFVKENTQILYTIFLIIAIPIAFIFSSQNFLNAAKQNQERLEKEKIGLMQDVFVEMVDIENYINGDIDGYLHNVITNISIQNPSIEQFKVLIRESGKNIVIASLDKNDIGLEDFENRVMYDAAGFGLNNAVILEEFVNGERHWKAIRAIMNENSDVRGFIFTDTNMVRVDGIYTQNIKEAYLVLFFIIIAIFFLLIRQTKIIDYAVLYKKLKDVDSMKDDFISMAAHELRTPLTIIRGYVSMLSVESFSKEDKDSVDNIKISVERLNMLINDILDVSRIQQGRMRFSPEKINPQNILQKTVDSFLQVAKNKNIELKCNITDTANIYVDPKRLEQVLINLIGNAVKYTKKGSVTVSMYRENIGKDKLLRMRISDTGVGISAENREKLFHRFSRVKTKETEDISGTGLGLWISNKIILTMGGTVTVESIEGKGSDFVVSFPIVNEK